MNEARHDNNHRQDRAAHADDDRSTRRRWAVLLPLLILLVAIVIVVALYLTREEPTPQPREERVVTVRTETVQRARHRLDVQARGRVQPARAVTLVPQVRGRIVEVNPRLLQGSLLDRDEMLVRIEEDEFRLAVQEAASALAEAQTQLALEEGRQEIAKEEWRRYGERRLDTPGPDAMDLVLRRPQLQALQAQVEAAQAGLERARLNLERTTIAAPFDVVVVSETAAVGQLADPQRGIAELVDSSVFWVLASIPSDRIDFVAIPGVNAVEGSPVVVRQDLGVRERTWEGRVVGLAADVAPEGMMARILVAVEDPFERRRNPETAEVMPLLLGVSVELDIEGRHTENLVEVPRRALREGDRVYVFTEEGVLSIRRPDIAWRLPQSVLVRTGVDHGERVIVSPMEAPAEGIRLREESGP